MSVGASEPSHTRVDSISWRSLDEPWRRMQTAVMPLLEHIQSPGSVGGQVERKGSPSDVDIDAVVAELARHCSSIDVLSGSKLAA